MAKYIKTKLSDTVLGDRILFSEFAKFGHAIGDRHAFVYRHICQIGKEPRRKLLLEFDGTLAYMPQDTNITVWVIKED